MKRHMGEKDAAEAAEYLRRAADQNHPWARCLLGKLCLTGSGIPKDEEATRNCFRMADSYGHPHARYVLERQKLPFTVSRLLCHMSYIFQHNAAASFGYYLPANGACRDCTAEAAHRLQADARAPEAADCSWPSARQS